MRDSGCLADTPCHKGDKTGIWAPVWLSGIVSSEVPESSLEFPASPQSPALPSFRNSMKALPLPSPKVLLSLRSKRYYGQLRFPCRPSQFSVPYIPPLPPCVASARTSRATPHGFPCVSPLLPRVSICRFWQFSLGQMFQPSPPDHRVGNSVPFTRLLIGSLPLQPAGLLGSLYEPLSRNLVLQVTLYTSLKLRGRTAQFPRPDFNW